MKKLCKAAFKETNKMPRIFHTPETTISQNVNYTSKKKQQEEKQDGLSRGEGEIFCHSVYIFLKLVTILPTPTTK